MKREIKFRAWFIKEKRMLTVDELMNLWSQYSDEDEKQNPGIKTTPHVTVINQSYRGEDLKLVVGRDCELMQYTGLKDKNGKEIYEGDIFTHKNCVMSHQVDDIVSFLQHLGLQWNDVPQTLIHETEVEVIGNICENPKLLK